MNLKPFNTHLQKRHFKMEGTRMIRDLLRKGDWMVSIDLKDAQSQWQWSIGNFSVSNGSPRHTSSNAYLSAYQQPREYSPRL